MLMVYSVYDEKMQQFGQLAVSKNHEAMRRAVLDGVKGSGSLLEKYPEDYKLYLVAEFDEVQGVVKGLEGPPVLVCHLKDLLSADGPRMVRDA